MKHDKLQGFNGKDNKCQTFPLSWAKENTGKGTNYKKTRNIKKPMHRVTAGLERKPLDKAIKHGKFSSQNPTGLSSLTEQEEFSAQKHNYF